MSLSERINRKPIQDPPKPTWLQRLVPKDMTGKVAA